MQSNDQGLPRTLTIPDAVLPVQFHPGRAQSWGQRVCLAVLEDALKCLGGRATLQSGDKSSSYRKRRLAQEAREWIVDKEEWAFSFENVCMVLGLESSAVSKVAARRWWDERNKPVPPNRDARCRYCFCSYTFQNAQAVKTQRWKTFCSPACEEDVRKEAPR